MKQGGIMYNIAICDDDESFRESVSNVVKNYITKSTVAVKQKLYSRSIFLIDDLKSGLFYDIYILDIEMPQISGIDIAKVIRKYSAEVIIVFVTSHLQYALESFELRIFRYIPKAMLEESLPMALKAIFSELDCQDGKFYLLSNAKRSQKIFFKDIIYIYKDEKNSVFVLNNQKIKVRASLFEVWNKLTSEDFVQIDRCYIVNIRYINTIDGVNREVYLNNKTKLEVSKNRIREIKETINKFWGAKM